MRDPLAPREASWGHCGSNSDRESRAAGGRSMTRPRPACAEARPIRALARACLAKLLKSKFAQSICRKRKKMPRSAIVLRLQRQLPLPAHGRPALLDFLRARGVIGSASPRLKLVGVFQAGPRGDLMCRFIIEGDASNQSFVAPLADVALNRRHPAAKELARRVEWRFSSGAA